MTSSIMTVKLLLLQFNASHIHSQATHVRPRLCTQSKTNETGRSHLHAQIQTQTHSHKHVFTMHSKQWTVVLCT